MAKSRIQRKNGGVGTDCLFSPEQVASATRKELAMAAETEGRYDDVPADLKMFVGVMANFAPGEPRIFDWNRHLDLVAGVNRSLRHSKEAEINWSRFPHTEADVRAWMAWRRRNPRG